jgi:hypothetical protein
MAQNIVVGLFEVESEAFQALTEFKQNPGTENSYLTAAALVKKQNGTLYTMDSFDTGTHTTDDMAVGGLVGALVGVLDGELAHLQATAGIACARHVDVFDGERVVAGGFARAPAEACGKGHGGEGRD